MGKKGDMHKLHTKHKRTLQKFKKQDDGSYEMYFMGASLIYWPDKNKWQWYNSKWSSKGKHTNSYGTVHDLMRWMIRRRQEHRLTCIKGGIKHD